MKNKKDIKDRTNKVKTKKITDIEISEFIDIDGVEKGLSSGNIVKIPLNIQKILELFEIKVLKNIKKSKKYAEGYKMILETELQERYEEVIEELQQICEFKINVLDGKILLEYFTKKPSTKIEKMSFQAFIDKTVKDIFGENIEENISDILVFSWLRLKELTIKNIKDILEESNFDIK